MRLKKLDIHADIFINTDNVLLPHHFNYRQAQEMENSGLIRIFSHFPTHLDLRTLSRDRFRDEFGRSFNDLDMNLSGDRPYIFAYPYSAYNEQTYRWATELGAEIQCVQTELFSGDGLVQRVTVKHGDSMEPLVHSAPKN